MKFGSVVSWLSFLAFMWEVQALSLHTNGPTRREFVNGAIVAGVVESLGQVSWASDDVGSPFCVIGANGKTGTKCVQYILNRGLPVRASSRSGTYNDDVATKSPLLIPTVCDVTVPSTVEAAVQGTRAVIFAASASKQGGTPAQVDNAGLVNVAMACIEAKVPHLVIVSSGSVTKPDSPVYKFLNLFGGIMDQKIVGEDAVRVLYANLKDEDKMTYTVIRPGGLTEDPARGVAALELNQGDTKSGRISRFDVASLCVESTFFPELTARTTFECYDSDTGKSLGEVGLSNIMKSKVDPSAMITGKERHGDTFQELFRGLERD
jgi:NAD(P)H-binding